MKHELTIISLSDVQLKCSCSWNMLSTYAITKAEAKKEFEKHCYSDFKFFWEKDHSISKVPSFTSWKANYKNKEKGECLQCGRRDLLDSQGLMCPHN